MLYILLAMAVWLPAMVGLGMPLAKLLRKTGGAVPVSLAIHTAICGLLGMFVASVVVEATCFFWPIHPFVSSSICILGWLVILRNRRTWRRMPRRAWRLPLVIALVVASFAARGNHIYDTGLYHLQAVRWMTHLPLPLGLANLHTRLGFNCAWFCTAAAIETPLLLGKSCFILNSLLMTLIGLPAVDQLFRMRQRPVGVDRIMVILLLLPLGQLGVRLMMISSISPDPVIAVLILFSIALWIRSQRFTPVLFVFACFAVTIKLSAVPFLMAVIVAWIFWLRRGIVNQLAHASMILFCLVAAVISCIHGIWLSGHPAYPTPFGRIGNLKWTALPNDSLDAAREIEYWAKYGTIFSAIKPGTPWMLHWLLKNLYAPELWIFSVVLIAGLVLLIVRRPKVSVRSTAALLAMIPAIVFWFIQAPAIRFGYGYLFGFAGLVLAIGCAGVVRRSDISTWRKVMGWSIFAWLIFTRFDRKILKTSLISWPDIPVAAVQIWYTRDGAPVAAPIGDDRVWDQPLTATPEYRFDLKVERNSKTRVTEFWLPTD